MEFYVDSDYRLHIDNPNGVYRKVEMNLINREFFNGKCQTFVEGYRFIPSGEIWTGPDGTVFTGEMVAPWKPYLELAAAQAQYEAMLADMDNAYREGVASA